MMSKLLISLSSLVVVSGISLTAAYAFGAFDSPTKLFDSLDEFKKSNGGDCVKQLFPNISSMAKPEDAQELSGSQKVEASSFNTTELPQKSCLVVNWLKQTYEESKGKGHLEFVGTYADKEGKGFIVFTQFKTKDTGGDALDVEGIAYTVGKTSGSNPEIKITKHKEITNRTLSKDDFETKFPKALDKLETLPSLQDWGKFVSGKNELEKVCGADACKGKPKVNYLQGSWSGTKNAGNAKPTEGSSTLSAMGSTFYDSTNWDMSTIFSSVTGTGKQESLKGDY